MFPSFLVIGLIIMCAQHAPRLWLFYVKKILQADRAHHHVCPARLPIVALFCQKKNLQAEKGATRTIANFDNKN